MIGWIRNCASTRLARLWKWLRRHPEADTAPARAAFPSTTRTARDVVHSDEQTIHPSWKSCHPRTRKRFKAEMVCGNGHRLVLSGHSVDADGTVAPSVVCRVPECDFHDFVRLLDWQGGKLH